MPPSVKPFAVQQQLLREQLQILLATLHPALLPDVMRAFKESGKLLSSPRTPTSEGNPTLPAGGWSLLPLLIAQCVCPTIDPIYASSVAVAVECFICALDLLDDVEDEDQTAIMQELGPARVLNVATVLLGLAQKAILDLEQTAVSPQCILHLLRILQETTLIATSGQHLDLLAEKKPAQHMTQEECIEISTLKAGSLLSMACRMGAVCADADIQTCARFARFGQLFGLVQQINNDCHDLQFLTSAQLAVSEDSQQAVKSPKTDLQRGKKTLPIVLAAHRRASIHGKEEGEQSTAYLQDIDGLQDAILAAWGTCLLYRERAQEGIREIEERVTFSPELQLLISLA